MRIGIILPVYQDKDVLEAGLATLCAGWSVRDIWVVTPEGDASLEIARRFGVRTVTTPQAGRALQMNAGASVCDADVFLFLHADTDLPLTAREAITDAIAKGAVGGAFARRFDSPSCLLRVTCGLAEVRGRLWGRFFGDQAIFCRRDIFEAVGGFPEQPLFEDYDFSKAMRGKGKTVLLRPGVVTSARRFDAEGPWMRTWKDVKLTWSHWRGTD